MSQDIGSGHSFVLFRLGSEEYGLPIGAVGSIIRYEESTPVPRAPQSVLGVINLRGRVIPVLDLGQRFGQGAFEPGVFSRIIVAEGSAGGFGIAVDAATEVASFAEVEIKPVPEGVLGPETARVFSGVVEREGSLVILVDIDEAMPRLDLSPFAVSDGTEEEESDV